MPGRRYAILDVFTDKALTGNPLAVVFDCEGLDDAAMQRIAREFNLSETVFLLPPDNPRHKARARIFTPAYEMPFAGHPTIGAAVALTETAPAMFVLEESIGPVRCAVGHVNGGVFAEFNLPKLPELLPLTLDANLVGNALGLGPEEIGFENHRVSFWSAGVPYVLVPVAGRRVAARAKLDAVAWTEIAPTKAGSVPAAIYVYCRETEQHDCAWHARMFDALYEDPATGSAIAAFAGAIAHFDQPVDGAQTLWIEQGLEMGRPSRIRLEMEIEKGVIKAARIGGHAVKVAEGVLLV